VLRHIRPAAQALVVGSLTLGGLDAVSAGSLPIFGVPALAGAERLIAAGVAAALGLVWQRLRLDGRLRRWIA
jgi:hypothetical protein